MTTKPQTDDRARFVAAIRSAPFEELRAESPNGPLVITARVDDLADAVLAAVSVPAPAPTDRAALAVRLAEAVQHGPTWTLPRSLAEEISVAVLAVLPAPADQTALLRTAALIEERADDLWAPGTQANDEMRADAAELSRAAAASGSGRVADETQAERPRCPHCRMPHDLTLEVAAVCASIRASIAEQEAQQPECACDPAPHREEDGTYSHWAGCPIADAQQAADEAQQTEKRQACHCGQDGCEYCDVEDEEACTCADAGDAFAPAGHYADCPQARPDGEA